MSRTTYKIIIVRYTSNYIFACSCQHSKKSCKRLCAFMWFNAYENVTRTGQETYIVSATDQLNFTYLFHKCKTRCDDQAMLRSNHYRYPTSSARYHFVDFFYSPPSFLQDRNSSSVIYFCTVKIKRTQQYRNLTTNRYRKGKKQQND